MPMTKVQDGWGRTKVVYTPDEPVKPPGSPKEPVLGGSRKGPVVNALIPVADGQVVKVVGPANRIVAYTQRIQAQGGTRVDWKTHSRQVLDRTRKEVQEILTDPYRMQNPRAQHEEAMRVVWEGQSAHRLAVKEAEEAFNAEMERLERQANPPPQRGQRSTAEMMERRELLDLNLPRWERSDGLSVIDEYQKALSQGDMMMVELIEDFAGQYIKDSAKAQEFGDMVYENKRERLPASAKAATEQLEELVKEESTLKGGMALQTSLMSGLVDNVRQGQPITMREDSPSYAEHERQLAKAGASTGRSVVTDSGMEGGDAA